jgi:glycosyltransferase involved in cell wall biosynthesis
MKIAQIAPLAESVPPRLYGGTERIVAYLTEELVRQGHDVTLFASGDSQTSARLVPCTAAALRLNPAVRDMTPHHIVMLDEVRRRAAEFDVLHFHIDVLHFPIVSEFADRTVTTVHGRLDMYDLHPCFAAFPGVPLVSVSRAQRRPLGQRVLWVGNVHHGVPPGLLPFTQNPRGDYFAFLGRISPEKRPDRAIEIAARTGIRLKIAAKVDRADAEYWRREIAPMIAAHSNVEYVGEIDEQSKAGFPRQCTRPAVPDRLARTVRPRDDRGDGVRDAGDRVRVRLGAGSHRRGNHRLHSQRHQRGGGSPAPYPYA